MKNNQITVISNRKATVNGKPVNIQTLHLNRHRQDIAYRINEGKIINGNELFGKHKVKFA